ncbi:MAG: hypothetical protein NZ901_03075 [Geminocystis sp.]|nr:hypothetical protein [Geminocystis sp.]HIK38829.1 hypothetical protein [Geminocystis sp. M7585_C2015_104]MCS7147154.1 hypothetical protein [Geminocystis sp.]MCX8078621.1 hypothetical protein [Geminocystis sp.]MDW8116150.1 hypothetical protein [Geminocystis sp.]
MSNRENKTEKYNTIQSPLLPTPPNTANDYGLVKASFLGEIIIGKSE